jgi:hypothetical protein
MDLADIIRSLKFPETRKYLRGIGGDIQESGVIPGAQEYLEGLGSDYYGATQGEFVDKEPGRHTQTGPETYGDMVIGGGRQEPGFLQNLGSNYYRASHPGGGIYQAGADLQQSGVIPKTRDVLESWGGGIANANIPGVVSNMQEDWRNFGGDIQDATNQQFNPFNPPTDEQSIQTEDATSGEVEAAVGEEQLNKQNPRGLGRDTRLDSINTDELLPALPRGPTIEPSNELYPGHSQAARDTGAGGILGLLSGRHGDFINQNKAKMKEYGIPLSLGDKYSSTDWEELQRRKAQDWKNPNTGQQWTGQAWGNI